MALPRILTGSREFSASGRGLHPLPCEAESMVRGLYSVVNRIRGGFHQPGQCYKMTNCSGLPGTKQLLSTDKCQFTNRESPEQMGKTDLLMEKLPNSGERLAAVLRHESN